MRFTGATWLRILLFAFASNVIASRRMAAAQTSAQSVSASHSTDSGNKHERIARTETERVTDSENFFLRPRSRCAGPLV